MTFDQSKPEEAKFFVFEPSNMTLALAPEWKQSILSGDIVIPKESIELSFSLESSLLGKETE